LVQTFCLTIGLGVKGGGHGGLNVTEGEETFPEVGGKEGVAIRDDLKGKTVETDDGGEEQVGKLGSRDGARAGDEVGELGEAAGDNEDSIKGVNRRKVGDEIEGDGGPRTGRDGEGAEGGMGGMTRKFVALTGFASADVLGNETSESREGKVAGKRLDGATAAIMTGKRGVMVEVEKRESESVVRGQVDARVLKEEVILGGVGVKVGNIWGWGGIKEMAE